MRQVDAVAPAKLNLALHVTGRRPDGYHLLDSLVAFVGVGDRLRLSPAAEPGLTVTGPMAAGVPTDAGNLVLRAASLFGPQAGTAIALDKHLPAAAGIGGGSSDAAACLTAMAALHRRPLPPAAAILGLGADVPVCLSHAPQRMRGIGERLDPLPPLPRLWAVLLNPRRPLPTAAVFAALATPDNPPLPAAVPCYPGDAAGFCGWLAGQRNDLEAPAGAAQPAVAACLAALSAMQSCLLARMSGSGATCFGLFATRNAAEAARAALAAERRDWWCAAGPLLAGGDPVSNAAPS